MRVITGTARGTRLVTLEGMETRPTGERVKEAVFSMVQFEMEGRRVLDLFAGSGQMGIEALSRGAKSATFVDSGAQAVQVIRQNLEHVRLAEKATVAAEDFQLFLSRAAVPFDVAFIDPPYSRGLAERSLPLVAEHMSPQGVIICETNRDDPMPESAGGFALVQKRDYGRTTIRLYRRGRPEQP